MKLEELGKLLAQKRGERNLSVEDVSSVIKVSVRALRSIENGSLQGLPHAVYTKGFIRAYGMHVGIDVDVLNETLEELFPPEVFEEVTVTSQAILHPVQSAENRSRFAALFLLLAIVCGIIWGSWYVYQQYGDVVIDLVKKTFAVNRFDNEKTPLVAAANGSSNGSAVSLLLLENIPSSEKNRISELVMQNATEPAELHNQETESAIDANATSALLVSTGFLVQETQTSATETLGTDDSFLTALEKKTLVDKNHIVYIAAAEDCYLGITVDEAKLEHYNLQANNDHSIVFTTSLKLLLGNPGGTRIRFDGNDIGPVGERGRPKSFEFPL